MRTVLLVAALAAISEAGESSCLSSTLSASTSRQWKSVYIYRNGYCNIFYIKPDYQDYYLEIQWDRSYYDINANMPLCKDGFVEVFLTRYYRSIGKFCSGNAGSPPAMYSKDGYAKVSIFNRATLAKASFSYQLVSKSSRTLGPQNSSKCDTSGIGYDSGLIYSAGWPLGYQKSNSSCNFMIQQRFTFEGFYVFFMDVSFVENGHPADCVQVFGSNVSTSSTVLSPKICGKYNEQHHVIYSKYLKITFDRTNGARYPNSGFLAGYVLFKTPITSPTTSTTSSWRRPSTAPTRPSSNVLVIVLVVTIAILVVMIIVMIVGGAVYFKRRHRQGSNGITFGQDPSSTITFRQGTNPTVSIGAEGSSTDDQQSAAYGNVVPQATCLTPPAKSSVPDEELQKPLLHDIEEQVPSKKPPNLGSNDNPRVSPLGTSASAATPTCNTVINS